MSYGAFYTPSLRTEMFLSQAAFSIIAGTFACLSTLLIEFCACCILLGSGADKQQNEPMDSISAHLRRNVPAGNEQPERLLSLPAAHLSLLPLLAPVRDKIMGFIAHQ